MVWKFLGSSGAFPGSPIATRCPCVAFLLDIGAVCLQVISALLHGRRAFYSLRGASLQLSVIQAGTRHTLLSYPDFKHKGMAKGKITPRLWRNQDSLYRGPWVLSNSQSLNFPACQPTLSTLNQSFSNYHEELALKNMFLCFWSLCHGPIHSLTGARPACPSHHM